ncbi:DNA-binding response regulator, NarL/FixJ family, contains REC and HTH domains [Cohaesibacter sp. ES.047]|uniref:response regulator n=1 Tax=Cohaesibacter sp. ES.047 TaxID=1798205 RepID=UPI000BC01A19|nr:response regulator transcription factor [Cohaesibacter sp. ES.047]SNY92852.1 DNA-binding response regulator, NarL/FixJ family, contains REC and HTH domains [Cohaesibacter sp. ES.047]
MRIILADDHPLYRSGLKQLLEQLFNGAVVDEAGDSAALEALLNRPPVPDLIITDLIFPGFDYMRDLKRLRRTFSLCPIIAVSMMNDPAEIEQIMDLGVNGFISKSVPSNLVLTAIENVMQGQIEVRISDTALNMDHALPQHVSLDELTPRQIEILKLLRHGLSNKEIARELGLSPFTVRSHVSALMKNLGVSNRAAASAIAASYCLT